MEKTIYIWIHLTMYDIRHCISRKNKFQHVAKCTSKSFLPSSWRIKSLDAMNVWVLFDTNFMFLLNWEWVLICLIELHFQYNHNWVYCYNRIFIHYQIWEFISKQFKEGIKIERRINMIIFPHFSSKARRFVHVGW